MCAREIARSLRPICKVFRRSSEIFVQVIAISIVVSRSDDQDSKGFQLSVCGRGEYRLDQMTFGQTYRSRLLSGALMLAFWTVIGLAFASQLYISSARLNSPISVGHAVGQSLLDWYLFAALAVPAMWLARRFPLKRTTWEQTVPIHIGASIAFGMVFMFCRAFAGQWYENIAGGKVAFGDVFQPLVVRMFHFTFLVYCVIVGTAHALDFYRQAREREMHSMALEKRLTEARLQALQIQLNPHFLFNTLHAISALMHIDVEAADRMIARLSDLLRYALESTDAQEVTLRQELDFIGRYIEIESTRFGPRLTFMQNVEPAALDVMVPNLILQPIVENAIRHGIEPHARPGRVELHARKGPDGLEIELRDNGDGLPPSGPEREGIGLTNTRERLAELYGPEHKLEFNTSAEGLVVRLVLPWRPQTRPARERFEPTILSL